MQYLFRNINKNSLLNGNKINAQFLNLKSIFLQLNCLLFLEVFFPLFHEENSKFCSLNVLSHYKNAIERFHFESADLFISPYTVFIEVFYYTLYVLPLLLPM